MAIILNLETSTKACSVSLGNGEELLAIQEASEEKFSHAEKLHLFIEKVVREAGITLGDIDAIAVGKGPGSYTGLRIGVSSAKGLAYGLDKPLIAISSLETITMGAIKKNDPADFYCPMFDARRMEVYTAVYNKGMDPLEPVEAIILEEDFRSQYLSKGKVMFFGDGSEKSKELLQHENAIFSEIKYPSSADMIQLSYRKYKNKAFEDSAYFEPFYLKDFIAGKPKKMI